MFGEEVSPFPDCFHNCICLFLYNVVFFFALFNEQEKKATGRLCCGGVAAIASSDASVSTVKGMSSRTSV